MDLLLTAIPTVVRALPGSKLRPFLKLVTIRALAAGDSSRMVVKGLKNLLRMPDLPPSTLLVVYEAAAEVLTKAQHSFPQLLELGHMAGLAECFALLPELAQNATMDSIQSLLMMIYLHCQLFREGKRSMGAVCNPFTVACSLAQEYVHFFLFASENPELF